MDMERIEKAVREILLAVGENPDREGLVETPERVAKMYAEVFDGLNRDPRIHTEKTFSESLVTSDWSSTRCLYSKKRTGYRPI